MAGWQYKGTNNDSFHVPTRKGYAVDLHSNEATEKNANAWLVNPQDGGTFYLRLTDIMSGFQNGGSFAQSYRRRQWFPRNFTQPRFTLMGQCVNQAEYANLVEFIRSGQLRALRGDQGDNVVTLDIPKGNLPGHGYQSYRVKGYVENVQRVTERFQFAPSYQFEFVIAYSYTGLYRQGASKLKLRKLNQWAKIFEGGEFVNDPDIELAGANQEEKSRQQNEVREAIRNASQTVEDIKDILGF